MEYLSNYGIKIMVLFAFVCYVILWRMLEIPYFMFSLRDINRDQIRKLGL